MFKKTFIFLLMMSLAVLIGCASTLEDVNRGAKKTGKTAGQVLRVPTSATEGAAEGIAGEAESNPYGR